MSTVSPADLVPGLRLSGTISGHPRVLWPRYTAPSPPCLKFTLSVRLPAVSSAYTTTNAERAGIPTSSSKGDKYAIKFVLTAPDGASASASAEDDWKALNHCQKSRGRVAVDCAGARVVSREHDAGGKAQWMVVIEGDGARGVEINGEKRVLFASRPLFSDGEDGVDRSKGKGKAKCIGSDYGDDDDDDIVETEPPTPATTSPAAAAAARRPPPARAAPPAQPLQRITAIPRLSFATIPKPAPDARRKRHTDSVQEFMKRARLDSTQQRTQPAPPPPPQAVAQRARQSLPTALSQPEAAADTIEPFSSGVESRRTASAVVARGSASVASSGRGVSRPVTPVQDRDQDLREEKQSENGDDSDESDGEGDEMGLALLPFHNAAPMGPPEVRKTPARATPAQATPAREILARSTPAPALVPLAPSHSPPPGVDPDVHPSFYDVAQHLTYEQVMGLVQRMHPQAEMMAGIMEKRPSLSQAGPRAGLQRSTSSVAGTPATPAQQVFRSATVRRASATPAPSGEGSSRSRHSSATPAGQIIAPPDLRRPRHTLATTTYTHPSGTPSRPGPATADPTTRRRVSTTVAFGTQQSPPDPDDQRDVFQLGPVRLPSSTRSAAATPATPASSNAPAQRRGETSSAESPLESPKRPGGSGPGHALASSPPWPGDAPSSPVQWDDEVEMDMDAKEEPPVELPPPQPSSPPVAVDEFMDVDEMEDLADEVAPPPADVLSLYQPVVIRGEKYTPIRNLIQGHFENIMAMVIAVHPSNKTRMGEYSMTIAVTDPVAHTDGRSSEDLVVTLFRKQPGEFASIAVGDAIVIHKAKMQFYQGRLKASLFSSDECGWVTVRGRQIISQSRRGSPALCPEAYARLQALSRWWHGQDDAPEYTVKAEAAAHGEVAGKREHLIGAIRPNMFSDIVAKIVYVKKNHGGGNSPVFELYLTDGSVNPQPTRVFHDEVRMSDMPQSALIMLAIFPGNGLEDYPFKPKEYYRFPNVRSNEYQGNLELKWSEKVTQEQLDAGWRNKNFYKIDPSDHRAQEIERRIDETKRTGGELVPAPAGAVPFSPVTPALAARAAPPSALRPSIAPPTVRPTLRTINTHPKDHPRSTVSEILADQAAMNKYRVQLRVQSIQPRGVKNSPDALALLWCTKCNQAITQEWCKSCNDKSLAHADARYDMFLWFDEADAGTSGRSEAPQPFAAYFGGAAAAACLPPLPPMAHGPHEVQRLRRRLASAEYADKVADALLGARMDGERTRPVIDWTVERFVVAPAQGARGVVFFSVADMESVV